MREWIVASRESALALAQTRLILAFLERVVPDSRFRISGITTQGDRVLDKKLDRLGGKGLFIKELEEALLSGQADFAVHSAKDLPARLADGLEVVAVSAREDARDALVSRKGFTLDTLPRGAIIGTSSSRRAMQLHQLRPDLEVRLLRGNVQTRLARLDAGDFDAIILAAAGLHRLGLETRIAQYLDVDLMIPAVGQGILAMEAVRDNMEARAVLRRAHDRDAWDCLCAERAFMMAMNGDCSVPLAAYGEVVGKEIRLRCFFGYDGRAFRAEERGAREQASALGVLCARRILEQIGGNILL